ncbi:MAG: trigger factor [Anaerolineae bacterium]
MEVRGPLKVTAERLESCLISLQVEVEAEMVERAMREVARRLSRRVSIPGFRRGKAPYHVMERVVGREAILNEALQSLGPEVYREAIGQSEIEPLAIATPQMDVVEVEPLILKFTFPTRPEVELGDYRSLRVDPPVVKVEEKEVESALAQLQLDHASWEPVDRPVEIGDLLVIDLRAQREGETIFEKRELTFVVNPDEQGFAPGLSSHLVGMSIGQENTFSLTYPADYAEEELAGRTVDFRVALLDTRRQYFPERGDDLAKTVGDYESLGELKEDIRRRLMERAEKEAEKRYSEEVMDEFLARARIEYPELLLKLELDRAVAAELKLLGEQDLTSEEYLELVEASEDELRQELRPRQERILRENLALGALIEAEKIDVTEEEVEAELQHWLDLVNDEGQASTLRQALSDPETRHSVALNLKVRRARDLLLEIARGAAGSPPLEKAPAANN